MKKKATATLEQFAAAQLPAVIDTEGYDDPTPPVRYAWRGDAPADPKDVLYGGDSADHAESRARWARKGFLRAYRAQCAWNDRTAKLLANTTPWAERPVPQADWSPKGMATWNRAHMSDYPLAQSAESKAFRRALKALGPDWQRDATPTTAGGACAECLYTARWAAVVKAWRADNRGTLRARYHDGPEVLRLLPIPHTCAEKKPTPTRRRAARRKRS